MFHSITPKLNEGVDVHDAEGVVRGKSIVSSSVATATPILVFIYFPSHGV